MDFRNASLSHIQKKKKKKKFGGGGGGGVTDTLTISYGTITTQAQSAQCRIHLEYNLTVDCNIKLVDTNIETQQNYTNLFYCIEYIMWSLSYNNPFRVAAMDSTSYLRFAMFDCTPHSLSWSTTIFAEHGLDLFQWSAFSFGNKEENKDGA